MLQRKPALDAQCQAAAWSQGPLLTSLLFFALDLLGLLKSRCKYTLVCGIEMRKTRLNHSHLRKHIPLPDVATKSKYFVQFYPIIASIWSYKLGHTILCQNSTTNYCIPKKKQVNNYRYVWVYVCLGVHTCIYTHIHMQTYIQILSRSLLLFFKGCRSLGTLIKGRLPALSSIILISTWQEASNLNCWACDGLN